MTICEQYLLIPYTRGNGLILADPSTGKVIWRKENNYFPQSNAVLHGQDIYMLGYFPEGCCIGWYTISGTYMGYIVVDNHGENESRFESIALIGDAIYWNDKGYAAADPSGDLWRFDLTKPLTKVADHKYQASTDGLKILFHKPGSGYTNVMGGQVLGFGSDVIISYENEKNASSSMRKPCEIIRIDSKSGSIIWEYQTKVRILEK